MNPGVPTHNTSDSKELLKEDISICDDTDPAVRNFDLNAEVNESTNENEDAKPAVAAAAAAPAPAATPAPSTEPTSETKHEEYPGWSLSEIDHMAIDPLQLAHLGTRIDEDEEDYDEEV